jgi:hypothetical protein
METDHNEVVELDSLLVQRYNFALFFDLEPRRRFCRSLQMISEHTQDVNIDLTLLRSDSSGSLHTLTRPHHRRQRRSRSASTSSSFASASLQSEQATEEGAFVRAWRGFPSLIGRANERKRRSRFHGWQWGILTGACVGTIVLVVNIIAVIIPFASRSGYEQGVATLLVGSTSKVESWNSILHVLINILSTLLLSASNYAMQVLSAPTRSYCECAHRSNKTLDIGVFSFGNVMSVSRTRRLLWMTLGLSSIPLHLL